MLLGEIGNGELGWESVQEFCVAAAGKGPSETAVGADV